MREMMDARVDNDLGDSVTALMRDGSTRTLLGFLTNTTDTISGSPLDAMASLWHFKVSRTQLPLGPVSIARLTAPRLPGVFRPGNDTDDDNGAYWLFDLQGADL